MGAEESTVKEETHSINDPITSITQFEIIKLLGKGAFAEVVLARRHHQSKRYAIKIMSKNKIKRHQMHLINDELRVLYAVSHPFIIKFYTAFQNSDNLYIVLDFMTGGDLFSNFRRVKRFTEEQVKYIAAMIILALDHLHKHSIVFRDLKPENILLDDQGYVRLTDFGLSKIYFSNQKDDHLLCGTPQYLAPETLKDSTYTYSSDYWALGCLIFELLSGTLPFVGVTQTQMFKKIITLEPQFDKRYFSTVSQDFLTHLLQKDPNVRPNFQEAIQHKFFSGIDFDQLLERKLELPYQPPQLAKNLVNISQVFDEEFLDQDITHQLQFSQKQVSTEDLMNFSGFMIDSSSICDENISDLRSRTNSLAIPNQESSLPPNSGHSRLSKTDKQ